MRILAGVSREGEPAPVIEELELSEPRAGEVLVRMMATGICHTDLRAHGGQNLPTPRPVVLGHEGAGIVEKVGEGVSHVKPGDHVALSGSSCGVCPSCLESYPSYCREFMMRCFGGRRSDGSTSLSSDGEPIHSHFFGQSSFATWAVADASGAVPIPKDVPFEIAAPLGCGVITGAGAVFYSFGLRPGQSIAIFGAGGVGLSAVMAAKLSGARQIVAVDPQPDRRALALELGATLALDPDDGDVAEAILAAFPGGVDFTLNTTTAAPVYDVAIRVLAMRGTAGFVSVPSQPWTPQMFTLHGKSMRGILGGDANPQIAIPMMLDYWRQGRFPIDRLVTPFAFEAIGEAFAACGHGAIIKPVLKMESA
jgi:aryl-alcohol dehydrogenase